MGRASNKENKNIYQLSRENCGLTRAQASEKLVWITDSRIEKIESGKSSAVPEEVIAMQEAYNKQNLCNYYCANECAIGKKNKVRELKEKSISEIVLEMLATLNSLDRMKERLIEITSDGKIDDEKEYIDFLSIQNKLENITDIVASLNMWMNKAVADGLVNFN
ncbi:MAG: helix-turn-helix domain-containing protein [Clostridia bacterium]|nr:helix-turn-helix domain-containing protein [Clostridia bacterium]